ncbi:MAG: hypothetical protein U0360_11440 [Dehalococcoidia bacterium]
MASLTDRETGRPRGFGFVEMVNADEALEGDRGPQRHRLRGRSLNVNEARPREDNRGGGGRGGYGGGYGGGGYGGGGYGGRRQRSHTGRAARATGGPTPLPSFDLQFEPRACGRLWSTMATDSAPRPLSSLRSRADGGRAHVPRAWRPASTSEGERLP